MSDAVERELDKDAIRGNLIEYTQRAFYLLPPLDRPRILDIGCGSGVPTLELARLTNGSITAIDVDQKVLDELSRKVADQGMGDRITILKRSLTNLDFSDNSFDIIWAEGSIAAIGFNRGLKEWRPILAPGRFLVIHDEAGDVDRKCKQVSAGGYDLLGHFTLSIDVWRDRYFDPLEKRIKALCRKYSGDTGALVGLKDARQEVSAFESRPERNCSAFFIMQKHG